VVPVVLVVPASMVFLEDLVALAFLEVQGSLSLVVPSLEALASRRLFHKTLQSQDMVVIGLVALHIPRCNQTPWM